MSRNETAVSWVLVLVAAGSREPDPNECEDISVGLQGDVQATPMKRTSGRIVQPTFAPGSSGIIKEGSDFGVLDPVDVNNISRRELLATVISGKDGTLLLPENGTEGKPTDSGYDPLLLFRLVNDVQGKSSAADGLDPIGRSFRSDEHRLGPNSDKLDFQPPVRSSDPTRSDSVRHVWVDLSVCTQGRGSDVRSRFLSEGIDQIKICFGPVCHVQFGSIWITLVMTLFGIECFVGSGL